ncbi:hypothetical protein [Bacillus atrophaeus]|uniref:Uncharacterized protein n=1 Tax=Bacillus atrophaeus (strain 1942) TaxID=720555 RepID=A0ABM5LXA1_BACA1|nr:hypothetical protein [Bacillus atrophaeus]AMR62648.1 hypothetical protein A1D11_09620 [Bacillus subtilis subsp. globigii]ADP32500.1 hypothetical protein BATR1942_07805 [Bacillus atrophaeus 1942]AIK47548.1 hypothetical protein DJ95_1458 [Bacillus atrophaeus subsp. globigii]EIM11702.1 hypothetical protein UY9_05557 [Bacillus atrophaeus C89]KFK83131.1 hypothetical protein DK44_2177 [Bacillus atrophaeus]
MNALITNLEAKFEELESKFFAQSKEMDYEFNKLESLHLQLDSQMELIESNLANSLGGSILDNCRNDLLNLGYSLSQVEEMSEDEVYATLDKIDEEIHVTDQSYSSGFEDLEKQIIEMKRDYFIDRKERGLGNFNEAWEGEILDLEYEYTSLCEQKGAEPLNHVIAWIG